MNIDIVLPYFNPMGNSGGVKINESRFRDYGFLKYVLRSIEKHCKFYRKLFLILQDETHIPNWLDTTNDKLQIVYHKDFIPEEFLPTYNSTTIEAFIHKIEDLSEYWIEINDDIFLSNDVCEEDFFKDDKLIFSYDIYYSPKNPNESFWKMVKNNVEIVSQITQTQFEEYIGLEHGVLPHKKSLEYEFFNKLQEFNYITPERLTKYRSELSIGGQYHYLYYAIATNNAINTQYRTNYFETTINPQLVFKSIKNNPDYKFLILNDDDKIDISYYANHNKMGLIIMMWNVILNKLYNKTSFELPTESNLKNYKITHSVWTQPYTDLEKYKMDLYCAALSCELLKQQGISVELHTDKYSYNIYKHLPYSKIVVDLNVNYPPTYFACGKYITLKNATAPTLNIDTDIFIYNLFDISIKDNCYIFDRNEKNMHKEYIKNISIYNKYSSKPIEYNESSILNNAGCVGGSVEKCHSLAKRYFDFHSDSFRYLNNDYLMKCNKNIPNSDYFLIEIINEQYLACNVSPCAYLNPHEYRIFGAAKGYWHALGLWKYKYHDIIKFTLNFINPELYKNITDKIKTLKN